MWFLRLSSWDLMVIKQVWLVWPYDCLETRQIEWKRSLKHWSLHDKSLVNIQKPMENSPFFIGNSNVSMALWPWLQCRKVLGYTRPGNLQVDTKKTQDQFPSNRCFMGIPRLSYWESPDSTDWTSMETVLWPELAGTVSHGVPSQPRLITQEAIWFHKL